MTDSILSLRDQKTIAKADKAVKDRKSSSITLDDVRDLLDIITRQTVRIAALELIQEELGDEIEHLRSIFGEAGQGRERKDAAPFCLETARLKAFVALNYVETAAPPAMPIVDLQRYAALARELLAACDEVEALLHQLHWPALEYLKEG